MTVTTSVERRWLSYDDMAIRRYEKHDAESRSRIPFFGGVVIKLKEQICAAVENETLTEPFNAMTIKEACPGWEDRDYHLCLVEHSVGNGLNPEIFERVSFGLYCLARSAPREEGKRGRASNGFGEKEGRRRCPSGNADSERSIEHGQR